MVIRRQTSIFENFDRLFDEFFDELLIDRWNCAAADRQLAHAGVTEHHDRYEVHIEAEEASASAVEIEVSSNRLNVKIPSREHGEIKRSFHFAVPIDRELTIARWSAGVLTILIPKEKGRRIAVKPT